MVHGVVTQPHEASGRSLIKQIAAAYAMFASLIAKLCDRGMNPDDIDVAELGFRPWPEDDSLLRALALHVPYHADVREDDFRFRVVYEERGKDYPQCELKLEFRFARRDCVVSTAFHGGSGALVAFLPTFETLNGKPLSCEKGAYGIESLVLSLEAGQLFLELLLERLLPREES